MPLTDFERAALFEMANPQGAFDQLNPKDGHPLSWNGQARSSGSVPTPGAARERPRRSNAAD